MSVPGTASALRRSLRQTKPALEAVRSRSRPEPDPERTLLSDCISMPTAPEACGTLSYCVQKRSCAGQAALHRRAVLRATAMTSSGFALPPLRAFAQSKISPPMQTLSPHMAAARSGPLTDEVAHPPYH